MDLAAHTGPPFSMSGEYCLGPTGMGDTVFLNEGNDRGARRTDGQRAHLTELAAGSATEDSYLFAIRQCNRWCALWRTIHKDDLHRWHSVLRQERAQAGLHSAALSAHNRNDRHHRIAHESVSRSIASELLDIAIHFPARVACHRAGEAPTLHYAGLGVMQQNAAS
ncbi:MAG: hypothetical protein A2Z30_03670 [Chloroflexi bacterium RBG_16_64_43]|nr:MAG: hypothetical protein A2Z30_03670 [Chloroflexi bacterium RBG_16_64_43]